MKETFLNYQYYSTKLLERLNYFSILSTENITKSLSYEEATKEYAAKKVGIRYYRSVSGS